MEWKLFYLINTKWVRVAMLRKKFWHEYGKNTFIFLEVHISKGNGSWRVIQLIRRYLP